MIRRAPAGRATTDEKERAMPHSAWRALGLTLLIAGPAVAQDEDPATKVEAVRQQIVAAAEAARRAVTEEQRVRDAATDALAALGESAIPALRKVVDAADTDPNADQDFVARCREALERLGWVSEQTKQRMAELLKALQDGEFDAGDSFAVLEMGGYAARELGKALDHADFKDKLAARVRMVGLLGMVGRAGRYEVLAGLFKRLAAPVAEECAAAAAAVAEAAVVPTDDLTGERDEKRVAARDAAVQAAGGVGPLLGVLARHASPVARAATARALGALERKDAVAALVAAVGDADGDVRAAVADALAGVTGQSLGDDAGAWQRWWQGAQSGYPAQAAAPGAAAGG
jgi:HEAT repeat protein